MLDVQIGSKLKGSRSQNDMHVYVQSKRLAMTRRRFNLNQNRTSKQDREITKITSRQITIRMYAKPSEQLFP